jgi:hypothetical protein
MKFLEMESEEKRLNMREDRIWGFQPKMPADTSRS